MKVKCCPKCGSRELGDRWVAGRKLQQYCYISAEEEVCGWKAEPRTPERRRISGTKFLRIDDFSGYDYVIYDKFGCEFTISRSDSSEDTARKEMERELIRGETDEHGGPYTGVLFKTPTSVVLKGKVFKTKKGVCTQIK